MPNEFKVGDVVELNSGGPKMTIVEFSREILTEADTVTCKWFFRGSSEIDTFPLDAITRCRMEPSSATD